MLILFFFWWNLQNNILLSTDYWRCQPYFWQETWNIGSWPCVWCQNSRNPCVLLYYWRNRTRCPNTADFLDYYANVYYRIQWANLLGNYPFLVNWLLRPFTRVLGFHFLYWGSANYFGFDWVIYQSKQIILNYTSVWIHKTTILFCMQILLSQHGFVWNGLATWR